MLFEIHDIILHRLWKWARKQWYRINDTKPGSLIESFFDDLEWHSQQWYMNHQRKIPKGMVAYVRVFNGLPW